MRKYIYALIALLGLATVAFATDSQICGEMRIQNILGYGQEESLKLGAWFTLLQSKYFAWVFLGVLIGVPTVFFLHYKIVGQKVFPHSHKKHYAFNLFHRTVHQIAAVSFLVIIPTGFIIVFGDFFGGGTFVRIAKNLHGLATPVFAITVLPMIIAWIRDMFPNSDDIKWMMIVGGYLSKEKRPVPAGKFNAGQKAWFWIAMPGGIVMILTGVLMFFLNKDLSSIATFLGMSQIVVLRVSAIIHNILGMVVATFFMVHVYMAAIAIKGAIHSMITGYKEEEEVAILHSSWYKQLKEEGKV